MLVVSVQVIGSLRRSKRIPGHPQGPLLHSHNVSQLMLVRYLPIPQRKAAPSLELAILS